MDRDKQIERSRYEARASSQLAVGGAAGAAALGSQTMPAYLQAPYLLYERRIGELIDPAHRVLELGAGSGLHTLALLRAGAQVVASDISPQSLQLLGRAMGAAGGRLETQVADMEQTPFDDASFDAIVSAGSLSYGDPARVDAEIRRLLRPGGRLIVVDSLNHNPVYRFNRWLHLLRGNRSRSTLLRMPGLARIDALRQGFGSAETYFFGTVSYAMPVLARITGENRAGVFSDCLDRWIGTRRSAFKFVLVARDFSPDHGTTQAESDPLQEYP